MDLWLKALFFGLFSASSLPIGAVLGLLIRPSEKCTARWMAFGSGALVFAVATQLYGESLFKLLVSSPASVGPHFQTCSTICQIRFNLVNLQNLTGILGAVLFWGLNRVIVELVRQPPAASRSRELPSNVRGSLDGDARALSAEGPREDLLQPGLQRTVSPIAALNSFRSAVGDKVGPEEAPASSSSFTEPVGRAREIGEELATPFDVENGHTEASNEAGHSNIALSMWLGLMLDGIPESLMLGFMTNENEITFTFLLAIFIANFPESFSGSAELQRQKFPIRRNMLMWLTVFLLTGILSAVGSAIMPADVKKGSFVDKVRTTSTTAAEGITGGAMLAMIATAMLPEAFKGAGEQAGILFVVGFVFANTVTAFGARYGNPQ